MHGSDPLDHDPAAENKTVQDLILAAGNRSDGRDQTGARGGGGTRRSSISAAARGSGSPELAKSGTPGVGLSRGKAMEHARGMRRALVAKSGHGDGWSVELDGGGGSAAQGSPAFGKLAKLGSKQGGFGSGIFSVPRRT